MFKKTISWSIILSILGMDAVFAMKRPSMGSEPGEEERKISSHAPFNGSPPSPDEREVKSPSPEQNEHSPLLTGLTRGVLTGEGSIQEDTIPTSLGSTLQIPYEDENSRGTAGVSEITSLEKSTSIWRRKSGVQNNDQEEKPLLLNGDLPHDDGEDSNLRKMENRLQRIEGRPFFIKWVYLDHLVEKMAYSLWLREKNVTGVPSTGLCNSDPLWVEGRGVPLKSGYDVARGITGFREGVEFVLKRSLSLILEGLIAYQIYQLGGFYPLKALDTLWNGDEQSVRGALAVIVQNPENSRYFFSLLAAPVLWGLVKAKFFARRDIKDTPNSFNRAVKVVEDFSLSSSLWKDNLRWLFPLHPIDREVNYLVYRLLLDGNLTLDQRKAGLKALIALTQNTQGWSKTVGLDSLQMLAAGTSLKQLGLAGKAFGEDYKEALLEEKVQAFSELHNQNPGIRKAGIRGLMHNLYADYLLWTLGDFNNVTSTLTWTIFKGVTLGITIKFFIAIADQIISYLNCPKPLEQGFTSAMNPAKYASLYNSQCLQAYLDNFNKVPGQPADTIVNILSKFHLDPSLFKTMNFSGRGVTGRQIGGILQGFQQYQSDIVISTLDLSNNNIGFISGDVEALTTFLPSTLTNLDLSSNLIEASEGLGTAAGAIALGNVLPFLTNLCRLNLSSNNIGATRENGTIAIENALPFLTNLQTLNLSHNHIGMSGENGTIALGNGLRFLSNLQSLDLSNTWIGGTGDNGTIAIGNGLRSLHKLQSLDLSSNFMGEKGSNATKAIAKALPSLINLTHLDLRGNNFGEADADGPVALIKALKSLKALNTLSLNDALVTGDTVASTFALAESLQSLSALIDLDLSGNKIGCREDNSVVALANSLQCTSSLTSLLLGTNCIGQTGGNGTIGLANTFMSLPHLQKLGLSWNNIGSIDQNSTISLVNNILQLKNLNSLYIQQLDQTIPYLQLNRLRQYWNHRNSNTDLYQHYLNSTEDVLSYLKSLSNETMSISLSAQLQALDGFQATLLMKGLSFLPNLQTLDLSCDILSTGGDSLDPTVLANTLPFFRRLTSLDLSSPSAGCMGEMNVPAFHALANALPPSLTHLDFSNWCSYTIGTDIALGQGLGHLTNLHFLNLSQNYIGYYGDSGIIALGESFRHFPYLATLDLSGNSIGGTGGNGTIALGESLNALPYLTYLDLSSNGIGWTGDNGTIALGESLRHYSYLSHLDLSNNNVGIRGDLGTLALAKSLNTISHLKVLNLGNNNIGTTGSAGAEALMNVIPRLICNGLEETNLLQNSFGNISWGTAADALEGLYSSQIQQACEANQCFGTPVSSPNTTNCLPSSQGAGSFFLAEGNAFFDKSSPVTFTMSSLFNLFQEKEQPANPLLSEDLPMGTEMVLFQEAQTPSLWESFKERLGFFEEGGNFQPSPLGLFYTSAVKGAAFTFVPEMAREMLHQGGVPKPVANMAITATQLGMIASTTTSYIPIVTGMTVNGGLTYMGVPPSVSSALGSTAAIAASIASGDVVTPTNLMISMGGGLAGSALALKAKNTISSWL